MGKGKGKTVGTMLVVTVVVGVALLGFGMVQLNFDLSFIGFDLTGNVTAMDVPEINEKNVRLLGAKVYVGTENRIDTSQRFAVGESFKLTKPTIITDFIVRLATQDPDVEVRGYIWDSDQSPPLRIAQASKIFNGSEIGTVLKDITFKFPQALVLEPTKNVTCVTTPCNPVPINYVVGIRVDKNLDASFTYAFRETTSKTINATSSGGITSPAVLVPITNFAVIDSNVDLNSEIGFTSTIPRGVIGIDIFHNSPFGEELMKDVEEIIEMSSNGTATEEEELIACIAIFPPPPECTGDNPLQPQECGLAEELMNGVCICKAGFTSQIIQTENQDGTESSIQKCIPDNIPSICDRQFFIETGQCRHGDPPEFPRLQVPPRVDPIVFIGAGSAILVIGLIGIGIRTFRRN